MVSARVPSNSSTSPRHLVAGRNVVVEPSYPFSWLAKRDLIPKGDLQRAAGRSEESTPEQQKLQTLEHVIDKIYGWIIKNPGDILNITYCLMVRQQ